MLMAMVLVGTAAAIDTFTPYVNHSIYTPVLSCAIYNYTIDNGTDVIIDRPLTHPLDGKYMAWFNHSPDTYYRMTLCDNTTMDYYIKSEGVDDMFMGLALLLVGAIIILIYLGAHLEMFFYTDSKGRQIPFITYLVYIIAGWMLVALVDLSLQAAQTIASIDTSGMGGIYQGFVITMLFISIMWVIGLIYAILDKILGMSKDAEKVKIDESLR